MHVYMYVYCGMSVSYINIKPHSLWVDNPSAALPRILAFTRYCYNEYCMVYGILERGRGGIVYCPIAVQ